MKGLDRSKRLNLVARSKPVVHYHGRTNDAGIHTVTLSIDGQRYEYTLTSPQCDTVEYLCRKVSALKALNFAASRATESRKI